MLETPTFLLKAEGGGEVVFDPLPSLDYTRAHRVVLRFSFFSKCTLDVSCLVIK